MSDLLWGGEALYMSNKHRTFAAYFLTFPYCFVETERAPSK